MRCGGARLKLGALRASIFAGVLALVGAAFAAELAELMQRAQSMLSAGQAQQAFELLSEVEFEHAGEPQFDYLLGVAALDAGKPDRATLAFDRVLAGNPLNAGALVDRGRAHAALGNKAEARADFEAALNLNPSPAVRARLEGFLAELGREPPKKGTRTRAYLALSLGHDSNVNFAASERDVFVPVYRQSFELAQGSRRQGDAFATFAGGGALDYVFSERYAWNASVDAYSKRNQDVHEFHLSALDLRLGPTFTGARQQLRVAANGGTLLLGDDTYRKHSGLGLDYRYALQSQKQLLAGVQYTRYRHEDSESKVFDTNQSVALLALAIPIRKDILSTVTPYVYAGNEDDRGGFIQGDKRFGGLGASVRLALTPTRTLTFNASAQRALYELKDPLFFERRLDRRYDASIAFSQRLRNVWTLRPQLTWTRQDSNLAPYDFERVEASVQLRRDFE
jgi:outer membrane protein